MIYFAEDGSYGDARNLVIVPDDALDLEAWERIELASDMERGAVVMEELRSSGWYFWNVSPDGEGMVGRKG